MVAFLAGFVVFLMIALMGAWATIAQKNERIAELEALRAPPTSPPWHVAASQDRETLPELWPAGELGRDDELTQACPRLL